ncbi:MAG: twin-arginine translocase subunit TatC [Acidimicrobiales bacterium]
MSRLTNFRALRGRKERRANPDGSMSLMDHLRELRNRLFKCSAAVVVCAIVVYFFYDRIYDFLQEPYCKAIKGTTQKTCELVFLDLTSPFATQLRISTYVGILFAMPVIFWQLWRFIAPGLYKNEKRYAISFVGSSVVLFMLGAALAYYSLPAIFQWLINQAGTAVIQNRAEDYFSLLALMVAAFGFSFEFPLLLLVLQLIGIVSPDKLASVRRHAIVGIVTVVAVVTPGGDPVSLFVLSIPLCLFYEASIWIARLMLRRRSAATPAA